MTAPVSYDVSGAAMMVVQLADDPTAATAMYLAAVAVFGCLIGNEGDPGATLAVAREIAAGDVTAYSPPL